MAQVRVERGVEAGSGADGSSMLGISTRSPQRGLADLLTRSALPPKDHAEEHDQQHVVSATTEKGKDAGRPRKKLL